MLQARISNLRRNAATRSWWERNTPVNAILDSNVLVAQPTTAQPIGPSARMAYLVSRQLKAVVPPLTLPAREGRS